LRAPGERLLGGSLGGGGCLRPQEPPPGQRERRLPPRPDLAIAHHYVKNHLVPFGEYVPLRLDEVLPIGNIVGASFAPGTDLSPAVLRRPGQPPVKLGIEICFDAIFPEISRSYARSGAEVLVKMTNDAWYGFSSAPFQFLRMVSTRAVETGRPVARAANTGISAFIDPVGRLREVTEVGIVPSDSPTLTAAELTGPEWRVAELPLLTGRTPYVVIRDFPPYLPAVVSGVFALAALVRRRMRRRAAILSSPGP